MAQQSERARQSSRRSLVECCPLYSNCFAYSSGVKGSGVELYRICRSSEIAGADADSVAVGSRSRKGSLGRFGRFSPEAGSVHHQLRHPSADDTPADHISNNSNSPSIRQHSGQRPTKASSPWTVPTSISGSGGPGGPGGSSVSGVKALRDSEAAGGDGYENPFVGAGPDFTDGGVGVVAGVVGSCSSAGGLQGVSVSTSSPSSYSLAAGGSATGGGGVLPGGKIGICGNDVVGGVGGGGGVSGAMSSGGSPGLFGSNGSVVGDGGVIDGGTSWGGGGGEGSGVGREFSLGFPLGLQRTSSVNSDPGMGRRGGWWDGSTGGGKWWRYPLEGRSTCWMIPKQEEQYVTCMRWFPHRGAEDMRMLLVGYSSGKVGIIRFSDDRRHGENVCVVAAASKGRACNAVAWDPARPARIAAGWAKSRHDKCVGVYDINYVDHWQRGNGKSLAQAIAARTIAATPPTTTTAPAPSTTPPPTITAGTAGCVSSPNIIAPSAAAAAGADSGGYLGLQHGGTSSSSSSGISGIIGAMTGLGFNSTRRGGGGGMGEVEDVPGDVIDGGQSVSGNGSGEGAGVTPFPLNSAGAGLAVGRGQAPRSTRRNAGGVWPVLKGNAGWDNAKVAAKKVHEFQPSASDGCYCLAWVPEHDAMLMAGMKHLTLTDTRTRYYSMKTLDPHRGAGVSGIAFRTTDPWMFATWSEAPGEVVKIWDYRILRNAWEQGKCRPTHPELNSLAGAPTSSVIDVSWSPDRINVVAVVRSDNPRRVCFWNVNGDTPEKANAQLPQDYRYTKDPISSLSWQRRGLKPRPFKTEHISTQPSTGPSSTKFFPENVKRALMEDERVALKFPHRLLQSKGSTDIARYMHGKVSWESTSAERSLVENIGPMERCPVAVSCHGDVMRAQGFCELMGSLERSGVRTRADYDACDVILCPRGFQHRVRAVRKAIAHSPKRPDILEVMKWRAQAGYRTDPVANRTEIFEREVKDQIAATNSKVAAGQQTVVTIFSINIPAGALTTGLAASQAIADLRSACGLWTWIARIEGLVVAERRTRGGEGLGDGGGGPMNQPFTPRWKPVPPPAAVEWREWDRVGLVDAGVIDILAEELEDAPGASRASPCHSRHPTLGCAVFHSPARALALRACGWGPAVTPPAMMVEIGNGDDGGACPAGLESGDTRLKECPGVPEGLGDLMLECERLHEYERSAGLAVFHGDLRAAVKALRRAGEAAKRQRLQGQYQKRQQQKQQPARASSPNSPTTHNRSPNPHPSRARVSSLSSTSSGQPHDQGQGGGQHASGLWSDPATLEKLLHAISVCVAGYRPPPNERPKHKQFQHHRHNQGSQPQGHDASGVSTVDGFFEDGAGRMWRDLTTEVLGRKELCGTDEPRSYLRACCAFLDAILESACQHHEQNRQAKSSSPGQSRASLASDPPGQTAIAAIAPTELADACHSDTAPEAPLSFSLKASSSFGGILKEEALSLSDRTALACMFLPPAELKTFLATEAERCVSGGDLEGVLLVGMAPRGIELLQAYVDRTSDVQTAALASIRAAGLYPPSWESERMQTHEWIEGYCDLLERWQFFFNRKKIRKFFEHEKERVVRENKPLLSSRLDAIKLRHTLAHSNALMPRHPQQLPSEAEAQAAFAVGAAAAVAAAAAAAATAAADGGGIATTTNGNGFGNGHMRSGNNYSGSTFSGGGDAGGNIGGDSSFEAPFGVAEHENGSDGRATAWAHGRPGFGREDDAGGGLPELRCGAHERCSMCIPEALEGQRQIERERHYSEEGVGGEDFDEGPPKPIIALCAKCKKPLPRCYICMQQSNAFDPATEKRSREFDILVREASRIAGQGIGDGDEGGGIGDEGDGVADRRRAMLEMAFNWCSACGHGGHSIHLDLWFKGHDECGVEGCRCECRKLDEPAARWPPRKKR